MRVSRIFLGFVVGLSLAFAFSVAPAHGKKAEKPQLCELRFEGESIKSITLNGTAHSRPGKILRLPAGKYRINSVTLDDDYDYLSGYGHGMFSEDNPADSFELMSGQPHTLKIGGPLLPTVEVTHQGRYLKLDYKLVDAEGRHYYGPKRPVAPRFVVYQDNEEIGSGKFAYG